MCSAWTPLKQPPHRSEVCMLSSDAKKVLETLREAYKKKVAAQLDRLQARNSSQHHHDLYRSSQAAPHDTTTGGQYRIKDELHPPPAATIATHPRCHKEAAQDDNTTVGVAPLRHQHQSLHQQLGLGISQDVDHPKVVTDLDIDKICNQNIGLGVDSRALSPSKMEVVDHANSRRCSNRGYSSLAGSNLIVEAIPNRRSDSLDTFSNYAVRDNVKMNRGSHSSSLSSSKLTSVDGEVKCHRDPASNPTHEAIANHRNGSLDILAVREDAKINVRSINHSSAIPSSKLTSVGEVSCQNSGSLGNVTVAARDNVKSSEYSPTLPLPLTTCLKMTSGDDAAKRKSDSPTSTVITSSDDVKSSTSFNMSVNAPDATCSKLTSLGGRIMTFGVHAKHSTTANQNSNTSARHIPDVHQAMCSDNDQGKTTMENGTPNDVSLGGKSTIKRQRYSTSIRETHTSSNHHLTPTLPVLGTEDEPHQLSHLCSLSSELDFRPSGDGMDQTTNLSPSSPVGKTPPSSGSLVMMERSRKRKSTSTLINQASSSTGMSSGPQKGFHSSSSFKTPFKGSNDGQLVKQQSDIAHKMEVKSGSNTCKSPFINMSNLEEADKIVYQERLQRATEVTMTLVYTDGSTQLREISQAKQNKDILCQVDGNSTDIVAASITYQPVPRHESGVTGNSEPSEGGIQEDTQRCYVLFPLDVDKKWTRDTLLSLMESSTRKVCFDAQELMHTIITQYRLEPFIVCCKWQQIMDPKIGAWLIDPDNPPVTFSDTVNKIGQRHSDIQAVSTIVKPNLLCSDLGRLSSIMQLLYQRLQDKQLLDLFMNVEMKLCPLLAAMEVQGIRVNTTTLKSYGRRLRDRIDELEGRAHKAAGHGFQVNSHVQLRQVLFDQLKLDQKLHAGQKLARTNVQQLKSTSEAVLTKLQDLHPLPKIVLEYRQLTKLNSTYVDGLLKYTRKGHLHTSWDQTSASTGRVQSSSPNLQNIPKQPIVVETDENKDERASEAFTIWAREPFTSQVGWTFIAADFQSIELRLLAHMSRDPVLLKVFNNKQCPDVFVELASEWLGMTAKEVTTADREKTKRIVYSVIYGVGSEKLAETLSVSKDEAKTFMKSFLNKFKSVSSFSNRCISMCQRHNGVIRTIFNRLRLIPNINSSHFRERSYAERQAVNFVVQGSAVDICKRSMIQVMHKLSTKPHLQARLLVQIHDELLLETPDEHVQEVKEILQSVMEATHTVCGTQVKLKVPLPVSVSIGKNWGHLTS